MTHKPVKTEFRWTGDGFGDANARLIKQLKRTGDIAIYSRTVEKTGSPDGFEVVKIGRHNGYTLGKQKVEPAETYPGSSAGGKQALYTLTLERAEYLFNEWVGASEAQDVAEAAAKASGVVIKKRGRPRKVK
jgi:hypothetical protein